VYLISTNPANERLVAFLLQDAPAVLWRLRSSDFFSAERGGYPTLGADRAAAARAAAAVGGCPALVVDGGTAAAYTCVGAGGDLEGGGIAPGLGLKLRSLAGGTGALPGLRPGRVAERIRECRGGRPLPLLSSNTEDAILSAVLRETAAGTAAVVELWRQRALDQLQMAEAEPPASTQAGQGNCSRRRRFRINAERRFFVTGGDGPLLVSLLSPGHSGILRPALPNFPPEGYAVHAVLAAGPAPESGEGGEGGRQPPPARYQHLVHYGIAQVLRDNKAALREALAGAAPAQLEGARSRLVGLRTARPTAASVAGDGSRGGGSPGPMARGTVATVAHRGSSLERDLYTVLYDDKAMEVVTVVELHGTDSPPALALAPCLVLSLISRAAFSSCLLVFAAAQRP
jgi:pantothenate kinase type III